MSSGKVTEESTQVVFFALAVAMGRSRFSSSPDAEATGDYNAANAIDARRFASSYYVRGLAKLALGDASGAADVAKGKAIEPRIARRFAGYGVAAGR